MESQVLSQYSRNLAVFKNQLTQLTEVFVVKLLPAITEALEYSPRF